MTRRRRAAPGRVFSSARFALVAAVLASLAAAPSASGQTPSDAPRLQGAKAAIVMEATRISNVNSAGST